MVERWAIPVVQMEPFFLQEDDAAELFSLSPTKFRQLAKEFGIKPTRLTERRLGYHREALRRLADGLVRRMEGADHAHE